MTSTKRFRPGDRVQRCGNPMPGTHGGLVVGTRRLRKPTTSGAMQRVGVIWDNAKDARSRWYDATQLKLEPEVDDV